MAARAEIEQVKLRKFNFKDMKSTADWSLTYELIKSCIEQLSLIVKQCLFQASNSSGRLQLLPEATIILKYCVALAM